MQLAPRSKEDWIGFALLPAKVLAVAGTTLLVIGFPFQLLSETSGTSLCFGFLLSVPLLLLGALIQRISCRPGSAAQTVVFVGLVLVTAYLGLWWGSGVLLTALCGWLMWSFIRLTLHREVKVEEPVECMECHSTIGVGQSRCSVCGWTFKP
jgi:hypothetical protein